MNSATARILPIASRSLILLAAVATPRCLALQAPPATHAPATHAEAVAAQAAQALPNPAGDAAACEIIVLDMSGPRPTARLAIGDGEPVMAIFDTGAAATVLRLEYAKRLGLPDQGEAAARSPTGTPMPGFVTTIESGTLGQARFGPAMAVALDIPLPLPGIDAILSPAVFAGRLVQIDLRAGEVRVLARTAATIPASEAAPDSGVDSPTQVTRIPAARLELPGVGIVEARLDTGSSNGLELPASMADSVPLSTPLEAGPVLRMVGSRHETQKARIAGTVRVGALELHDPEVLFIEGVDGATVGMQVLREVVIVLDPAEHRSWVLPASAPAR